MVFVSLDFGNGLQGPLERFDVLVFGELDGPDETFLPFVKCAFNLGEKSVFVKEEELRQQTTTITNAMAIQGTSKNLSGKT